MFHNYRLKNLNLRLIIYVIVLTVIGILVIGSANSGYQNRQIIGMVLGIVVMTVIAMIDYEYLLQFTWIFYALIVLLLGLVLLIGDDSGGATRWIDLGIRFQPSELCKVLLILFFARYFMNYEDEINQPRRLLITLFLLAVPVFLILREPDLSTTIVTVLIIFIMCFATGLSYKIIAWLFGIGVPAVLFAIFFILNHPQLAMDNYQFMRILGWLRPDDYPQSAYQQQNSIMAIGSGQLFGKGLYNNSVDSVKNGNYISEPQTDFIFSVAGEELGFVGSILIVILIFLIAFECIRISRKAKDKAGQLICIGIASLISVQGFVNICVVTGLMPNTGLPLPFVSYGLTSLVTLYIGIGFVLNVGLQAKKYT